MLSEQDEDPPNYYDCLLVKNRLANLVTAQSNHNHIKRLSALSSATGNSARSTSESGGSSSDETENRAEYELEEGGRDEADVEVSVTEVVEDEQAESSSRDSMDLVVVQGGGEGVVEVGGSDNEATLNDATMVISAVSLARSGSDSPQTSVEFSQDSLDRTHYY